MKIGKPLTLFLAPPTDCCLHCGSSLQIHHEPTTVICFTLNGPVPAQKVTLRCKKCQISYCSMEIKRKDINTTLSHAQWSMVHS